MKELNPIELQRILKDPTHPCRQFLSPVVETPYNLRRRVGLKPPKHYKMKTLLLLATCVILGQAAPGNRQRRQFLPTVLCPNGLAVQKFALPDGSLCFYLPPATLSVSSPLQTGPDACPAVAHWLTLDWCGDMRRQCYCCDEATTADECLFCYDNDCVPTA
ncbi:hypothetical protein Bbelb_295720 [Branchiostoma belcheri]|nr:hypothetical protein Bbelb_295720 [Branchiostoma belcheri]